MYKKQKIKMMIEIELHAPNLLSTYNSKKDLWGKSSRLNKSIINL